MINDEWGSRGEASDVRIASRQYTNRNRNSSNNRTQGQRDGRQRGQRVYQRSDCRDSQREDPNGEVPQGQGIIIQIERSQVGKLIGRGGSKIRELEETSNAGIKIDKNSENGEMVSVRLVGSDESQRMAKDMIDALLNNTGDQEFRERSDVSRKDQQYQNQHSRFESQMQHQNNNRKTTEEQYESNQAEDFTEVDWEKAKEEHARFQKERWAHLGPIIKEFYNEDPAVTGMSKERVTRIRRENRIECCRVFEKEGEGIENDFKIPNPVESFEQAFRNYPDILVEIGKQSFVKPSPIQCQAWPILLGGKDLIGIAQTGTGKTLGFLLPALIHIEGQPIPRHERGGPNVLIMAPTRELALQIEKEVGKYSYRGIRAVCVYGGGSRQEQMDSCRKGVQIVIATPGRLNDLLQTGVLDVKSVTYLVLDEADHMLDMGFEPQIRKILVDVRPDRQTVMTSATWPQGVRRLAQSYMKDPIQIFIGSLDLATVHSVRQTIHLVSDDEKTPMLYEFFRNMSENDKVIVFFGKKSRVDDLASELAIESIVCQSIHGGRDQLDREQALEDIKSGAVRILLATDVASRGIDIEDITHVFNYDFPRDIEEYVHRVGRTGRAGRTGESISLMTRQDWSHAKKLINILEEASQEVPEGLYKMSNRYDAMKEKKAHEKERDHLDGVGYTGDGGDGGRNRRGRGARRGGNRW